MTLLKKKFVLSGDVWGIEERGLLNGPPPALVFRQTLINEFENKEKGV